MQAVGRRPQARSGLSTRVVKGETVVLDRDSHKVHQFNNTAGLIWSLCTGKLTEGEIAQRVVEKFDVEPAQAAKDVKALLAQFLKLGLLGR